MKNLLVFITFTCVLFSCAEEKPKLYGNWVIYKYEIPEHTLKEIPEEHRSTAKNNINEFTQQLEGKVNMVFLKDGRVKIKRPNPINEKQETENSNWTMDEDNDKLTITNTDNQEAYKIIQLTKETLHLENDHLGMIFKRADQ